MSSAAKVLQPLPLLLKQHCACFFFIYSLFYFAVHLHTYIHTSKINVTLPHRCRVALRRKVINPCLHAVKNVG